MKFKKSHWGMKAMNLQRVGRCEKSAIGRFFSAEMRLDLAELLMRATEKLFEQPEFVHQLQGRRMYRVAAKIAQEIFVLF